LGAISVNAAKSYATRAFAEQWLYFLGGLFIFATLFMPKGIIGLPEQFRALWKRFGGRKNGAAAPAEATTPPATELKAATKE
jgi:urea transport system permease protein